MIDKKYRVLEIVNKDPSISQRNIADKLGISIGSVNSVINHLADEGYIRVEKVSRKSHYVLNDSGLMALEKYIRSNSDRKILIPSEIDKCVRQAVILAAGERNDFDEPVGLLELGGETVIERIIRALRLNGIEKIIIVTGFKSHRFERFREDKDIFLVENKQYRNTGTMQSLALAKDLVSEDFLLIESDIVFEYRAISDLLHDENRNCILVTNESGSGDEAFVEFRNGYIYKVSKDKHQFNRIDGEMIGISKVSLEIYNKMLEEFEDNKNPLLNYEYVLLDIGKIYNIGFLKLDDLIWTEIDIIWHYRNLINYIYPILLDKELKDINKY